MGNSDLYTMSDEAFAEADPEALFMEAPSEPLDASEEQESVEEETGSEEIDIEIDSDEEVSEPENLDVEDETDEEETDEVASEPEDSLNYEELYGDLLAPLKHKGSEFDVKSVEDARRLMSMGLDYAKKTRSLKEQRKYLKMLDNNELLDETKLSYAIELMNGNPQALAQLVKEKNIDTYSLNQEEDSEYTPSNHAVGDHEVELDEVIESIRSTTTYADTMNEVNNWDESSKRTLAQQPQLLALMNEHKSNGIFALVQKEMDRELAFGGLSGLSNIEAYQRVGDKLYREGKFQLDNAPKAEPKRVATKPKAKMVDEALEAKRKKAAPAKSNSNNKPVKEEFDFWNMPDDEFEKFKL